MSKVILARLIQVLPVEAFASFDRLVVVDTFSGIVSVQHYLASCDTIRTAQELAVILCCSSSVYT